MKRNEVKQYLKPKKRTGTDEAQDAHGTVYKYGDPILFFVSIRKDNDGEDEIIYQGYIDETYSTGASGVLFEWIMGEQNGRINMTDAFLDNCIFFYSDTEMNSYIKSKSKR